MRYPLHVMIRAAKNHHMVPAELRHSGILSFEWMVKNFLPLWTWRSDMPNGFHLIEEVADRIYRGIPVKADSYFATCRRISERLYEHRTPLDRALKKYSGHRCGDKDSLGIRISGEWTGCRYAKVIRIEPAPKLPCRWCGRLVFYRPEWIRWDGTVRCNAPDCRRIDYLADKPKSKGGIALTPAQRITITDREARNTQVMINYAMLRAREVRKKHAALV